MPRTRTRSSPGSRRTMRHGRGDGGGIPFSILLPGSSVGLIGSIVVPFIGAVVLIALVRALPGRSPV